MSDLQIVLILLGFIIIAGVLFYNWRQEKKLRDAIRNDFLSPQEDVLADDFGSEALGEVRVRASEPVADANPVENPAADEVKPNEAADISTPETETAATVTANAEPAMSNNVLPKQENETVAPITAEATVATSTETVTPEEITIADDAPPIALPSDVNEKIDLTAVLSASKAINGQALYGMINKILNELGSLVMQYGLDRHGDWHRIDDLSDPGVAFETVACSLQLVDRRGPVAKPLINKFEYAMEAIGLEFDATVKWQGEADAAQRAVELDAFCIEVDQLISIHVLQGDTPIHGTKFKGMAEANDLKLRRGKFHCVDNDNPDLIKYVLGSADEQPFSAEWLRQNVVKGVVFQIEIPKVENVDLVFNQMTIVAQQMANSLGAKMVDDNQRLLGNAQIDKIKQQLKVINSKMIAYGIAPGSASSTRLFN